MKGRVELPSGCGGPVSFGRGYVVIRADGQLLAGFGYGGPGRPVAYWRCWTSCWAGSQGRRKTGTRARSERAGLRPSGEAPSGKDEPG